MPTAFSDPTRTKARGLPPQLAPMQKVYSAYDKIGPNANPPLQKGWIGGEGKPHETYTAGMKTAMGAPPPSTGGMLPPPPAPPPGAQGGTNQTANVPPPPPMTTTPTAPPSTTAPPATTMPAPTAPPTGTGAPGNTATPPSTGSFVPPVYTYTPPETTAPPANTTGQQETTKPVGDTPPATSPTAPPTTGTVPTWESEGELPGAFGLPGHGTQESGAGSVEKGVSTGTPANTTPTTGEAPDTRETPPTGAPPTGSDGGVVPPKEWENAPGEFAGPADELSGLSGEVQPGTGADEAAKTEEGVYGEGISDLDKPEDTYYDRQVNDLWNSIQDEFDRGLGDQYKLADQAAAAQGRRALEMSAMMGAQGGGGSFQAGQAQMGLAGQQLRMKAAVEHQQRSLQFKMQWLENMLQRAENDKNRDLEEYLQNLINQTQMAIAKLGAGDLGPDMDLGYGYDPNTGEPVKDPDVYQEDWNKLQINVDENGYSYFYDRDTGEKVYTGKA